MSARRVTPAPIVGGRGASPRRRSRWPARPAAVRLRSCSCSSLLGPGMAFVPLLGLGDPVAELTSPSGISLAVDLAVALAMLYAGAWSPPATLVVVAAIALGGAALQRVKPARPA